MDSAEIKTNVDCPTKETLQQLISGTVKDVHLLESHLQACVACRDQLDRLSQSDVLKPFLPDGEYHLDSKYHFLSPPKRDVDLGSINGLYIEREIGRGGAGIVFQGFDPELSRAVAIKVLSNVGGFRSDARFKRESKVAAKIRNDHVVSVHAIGKTDDGRPYIMMPLISGMSLKEALRHDFFEERRAVATVAQIASGLQALHAERIVHRDVKPANILLDETDSRAKLTDFGLARETLSDDSLTQADVVCGTPEYMSPEQASGQEAVPQSDIYSLGITLYECLTGTTPFRGKPLNVLRQHCHNDPVRPGVINPKVSRDIETICLKAISKEPKKRYLTGGEMAEDLKRFLAGQPIRARATPAWEKLYLWSRRNPGIATMSAVTCGLLLTLAIVASLAAWNFNQSNVRIRAEKSKANQAEQRAVQDRTAAVTALTKLVDSLYDDLSDNSATIQAREKLVSAAMDGLQSVTRIDSDAAGDRTTFLALLRMANLLSLKGDTDTAEKKYEQAIELARDSLTKQIENDSWKIDLATALSELGVLNRTRDAKRSKELNTECQAILVEILDRNPDHMEARTKLVVEKGYLLELIRNENFGNPTPIIEYGNQVLIDLELLLQQPKKDHFVFQAAYMTNFLVGRAYLEQGDSKTATDHFDAAKSNIKKALIEKPNNFYLKSADASLDRALSMANGSLGRIEESLAMFRSSVNSFRQLVVGNPENLRLKSQLANTLSLGSNTLLFSDKAKDALDAVAEAEQIYNQLIDLSQGNKDSYQILLTENQMRRTYILLSIGQWNEALEQCGTTLSKLDEISSKPLATTVLQQKQFLNQYNQAAQWLCNLAPASPSLVGKVNAILFGLRPDALNSQTLTLSKAAISLVQRIDSNFSGTSYDDLFRWLPDLIESDIGLQTQADLVELGVYALIARNCSVSSDEALKLRCTQCIEHCVKVLQRNPLNEGMILGNPDLNWLRESPQFQELLPHLNSKWNSSN